jgi:hypoxanthine phosphoribosyltransferase
VSAVHGDTRLADARAIRQRAQRLATPAQISATLDRLAAQLTAAVGSANPVLLAVMHGGMFAAAELMRRLDFAYEFDYVQLSRYRDALHGGRLDWIVRPSERLSGRTVVIIDDILDRGDTLTALQAALAERAVARQYSLVLIDKQIADNRGGRPRADFVGMPVADRYVFGCGMDYKGYWRGLPALYAVADS